MFLVIQYVKMCKPRFQNKPEVEEKSDYMYTQISSHLVSLLHVNSFHGYQSNLVSLSNRGVLW